MITATTPNTPIVVINDKPTFTIREFPLCTVCNEPVWQYTEGPCRHIMHDTCVGKQCRVCVPSVENTLLSWILWFLMGNIGASHLLTKEYYLAILHAMCPGYFYLFRISTIGILCNVLGLTPVFADQVDELVFVFACSQAYRPEFAVVSMWVAGFYYVPVPNVGKWTQMLDAVTSMLAMSIAMAGLHHNKFMGTLVLALGACYYLWSWPRLWDFHLGNCFGLLSISMFASLCIFIAGVIENTFDTHVVFKIFIVSRLFFRQRDMKNFFSPIQSQGIVYLVWQLLFTINTNQINYYKSIT